MIPEGLVENTHNTNSPAASGNGQVSAARCSKCGDLAASRRCRSCGGVDMCAACHFLAHRSPSRRSHVTELLGENAIFVQEALHCHRKTGEHKRETGETKHTITGKPVTVGKIGSDTVTISPASATSGRRDDTKGEGWHGGVRCDDKAGGDERGDVGVFGEDAVRSLEEVRRTVPPPVVRPLLPAGSSSTENSRTCSETEIQSEVDVRAMTDPLDHRRSTTGDLRTLAREGNDGEAECLWGGETNMTREEMINQGGAWLDGEEVEESEGASDSDEEGSDDEGMVSNRFYQCCSVQSISQPNKNATTRDRMVSYFELFRAVETGQHYGQYIDDLYAPPGQK